jgi:hypothetical protein
MVVITEELVLTILYFSVHILRKINNRKAKARSIHGPLQLLHPIVQEPLLYRCSLTARIAWCYQTLHAKAPFRTLFHVLAPKMDFSITSGQVPLLYRLHFLLRDLIDGEVGPPRETARDQEEEEDGTAAEGGQADSGDAEEGASASSIGRHLGLHAWIRYFAFI